MRITPIDIAHKNFGKKMFGLDPEEVADFLQQIASQMETLIHERNSLKEAVREKDLANAEYKERDKVLKETISTASQMAERLRQDAEREGKLIIVDAQQKAEMITRDSRDSLKKMYQEMTELKRARMQFEANLKALAQAHLTLLEQGEKYMPQMQLPNLSVSEAIPAARSSSVSPLASE
ncbi:MAG TPA: DivIVA domain-containing protein [Pseudobdellovibrionaceae bacterium]|nr:DivIVA domain-containing protein [Pseudobdellovibrionaceae bacterium]